MNKTMNAAKRPRTIQIFLPDGSPRGIKIADITAKVVMAILIPRNKLKDAKTRDELNLAGVYFLLGRSSESGKPLAYIGEAESCLKRVFQHDTEKKDFWDTAIVCISKTNSLTKSHVKYLENYCVEKAKEAGRYKLENSTVPIKSYITESMEADVMDLFDDMSILLSTLGHPLFEPLRESKEDQSKHDNLWYCSGKLAQAKGEYTNEGMVILKGSTSNKVFSKSSSTTLRQAKEKLILNGALIDKGNVYEFKEDTLISSVSTAAAIILSRSANGWIEWKDQKGRTMDEVLRK